MIIYWPTPGRFNAGAYLGPGFIVADWGVGGAASAPIVVGTPIHGIHSDRRTLTIAADKRGGSIKADKRTNTIGAKI